MNHDYYNLKHPGAIYNDSINELLGSIEKLIREVTHGDQEGVKITLRLVLSHFYQFYESCYEMIIPFCNQNARKLPGVFWHKWLENNKYKTGKLFHELTYQKVKGLKNVYNELKHTSTSIQLIQFYNGKERNFGYFLSPTKPEVIFPISVSRQIRELHYLIYFISEKLLQVLIEHNRIYKGTIFSFHKLNDDGLVFKKLFDTVTALPGFYLLNEVSSISYEANDLNTEVHFEEVVIEESLFDDYYKDGIYFNMVFINDGYNNQFIVPMCGMKAEGDPMRPKLYYLKKNGEKVWIPIVYFQDRANL